MNNNSLASSILTVTTDIDVSEDLNCTQNKTLASLINEKEDQENTQIPQTSG